MRSLKNVALQILVSVGVFASFAGAALAAPAPAGTIKLIKGQVEIHDKASKVIADTNGTGGRKLEAGAPFYVGETVVTKADGRVKLEFVEGKNEVTLGTNTSLFIERASTSATAAAGTTLSLASGEVRSSVNHKYSGKGGDSYEVKTPNAVAGVRGTIFLARFNPMSGKSDIATERGLVAVKNLKLGGGAGREVVVKPGMFTSTTGATPPAPPAPITSNKELQGVVDQMAGGKPASGDEPDAPDAPQSNNDTKPDANNAPAGDTKQDVAASDAPAPDNKPNADAPKSSDAPSKSDAPKQDVAASSDAKPAADAPAPGPAAPAKQDNAPAANNTASNSSPSSSPSSSGGASSGSAGAAPAPAGSSTTASANKPATSTSASTAPAPAAGGNTNTAASSSSSVPLGREPVVAASPTANGRSPASVPTTVPSPAGLSTAKVAAPTPPPAAQVASQTISAVNNNVSTINKTVNQQTQQTVLKGKIKFVFR